MVAIVTEAWALAGCGAASKAAPQEAPVQHPPPPAVAKSEKTASSFRGASIIRCQDRREAVVVGRRSGLVSCVLAASFSPLAADRPARAAVLEEDDDIELLERVKEDRKKRLQRQGVISSSGTETGQLYLLVLSFFLCFLIYKLSKVGQAIEKDDLPAAGSVLGSSSDARWVQNVNAAFSKFSSSPEERDMVDSFNSSLASLITSVNNRDAESSKSAFVSSATALEKWIVSAGLGGQLKGY